MIPATARAEMIANFRANFGKSRMTDFKPVVKVFDPSGSATWLLSELAPGDIALGLCDLGQGTLELGYVSVHELAAQRNRLGLLLEINRHFRATKTLSEYADAPSAWVPPRPPPQIVTGGVISSWTFGKARNARPRTRRPSRLCRDDGRGNAELDEPGAYADILSGHSSFGCFEVAK
jgi:hypothetical protein